MVTSLIFSVAVGIGGAITGNLLTDYICQEAGDVISRIRRKKPAAATAEELNEMLHSAEKLFEEAAGE